MKIRTRLILLFVILVAGFAVSAAFLKRSQREEATIILASVESERSGLLDRILALMGQSLENFAGDYAQWDEMVQFVQTKDRAWAAINIDPSLANFDAQAAWVIGLDGEVLYTATRSGLEVPAPTQDPALLDRLRRDKLPHFFLASPAGLLEIRTAPIQPSEDIRRETPGRGWFIVARAWDEHHLSALAEAMQSRVTLTPLDAAARDGVPNIHVTRTFSDWQGRPLQVLHVEYESQPLVHLLEGNRVESFLLYAFGVMVISAVMIGISYWVLRPLSLFGLSLESGRTDALRALQGNADEFGHLARQITQSFVQRDALQASEERLRQEMDLRRRLARDLHDGIIQSVYAAGIGLESVRDLPTTPPDTRQRLEASQRMLNDTLWQVRTFILSLEPESVPSQSPAQSLATLAASIHSLQHIPITTDLDPALAGRIDGNQELHLLQAAREMLSNALRHSGAREMHLSLRALPDGLAQLEVRDNGMGFDPTERMGAGRGLANLATRAREFGAQLAIDSRPGNGTRITLEFRPSL
ncbi:MAG TPA: CHASE4 domain-containing protein [Lacunisphaera sp.]|nr:CHASE4 domain-containing protein [Lacunisphaera sp.]